MPIQIQKYFDWKFLPDVQAFRMTVLIWLFWLELAVEAIFWKHQFLMHCMFRIGNLDPETRIDPTPTRHFEVEVRFGIGLKKIGSESGNFFGKIVSFQVYFISNPNSDPETRMDATIRASNLQSGSDQNRGPRWKH